MRPPEDAAILARSLALPVWVARLILWRIDRRQRKRRKRAQLRVVK